MVTGTFPLNVHGTYPLKLDAKGRFFLPSKLRGDLAGDLFAVIGQERCVYIFTPSGYAQFTSDLQTASNMFEDVRSYRRVVGAGTFDTKTDSQFRIAVPPPLREYARLERDVVVIGAIDRVEIWDQQLWDQYFATQLPLYRDINKQIGKPQGGAQ